VSLSERDRVVVLRESSPFVVSNVTIALLDSHFLIDNYTTQINVHRPYQLPSLAIA
jgi:hypothetical protein